MHLADLSQSCNTENFQVEQCPHCQAWKIVKK